VEVEARGEAGGREGGRGGEQEGERTGTNSDGPPALRAHIGEDKTPSWRVVARRGASWRVVARRAWE